MSQPTCFLFTLAMGWMNPLFFSAELDAVEPIVSVGTFTQELEIPPQPWRSVSFNDEIPQTIYHIILWDKVMAIEASANSSMALLARPLEVDLFKTPVLCWRWRVDAPLKSADMAQKSGDDYAARVYVTFDLPDNALNWTTRLKLRLSRRIFGEQVPDAALNYVWDNRYPIGTERSSVYTERIQMLVLQSVTKNAGQWVIERRNVLADAQRNFGEMEFKANLLAVASDTDNTGELAHAGFADLHFVGANANCSFMPTNN